jgi:hypothetical protein
MGYCCIVGLAAIASRAEGSDQPGNPAILKIPRRSIMSYVIRSEGFAFARIAAGPWGLRVEWVTGLSKATTYDSEELAERDIAAFCGLQKFPVVIEKV